MSARRPRSSEWKSFLRTWLTGYVNPSRAVLELIGRPAPHWGLYAQILRALLDSLVLYLPLHLMGRAPATPSYLTFLPTESYYQALTLLAPLFLLGQWLLLGAVAHVALRLLGHHSDVDQILNVTGMAALVVGAVLVLWDWLWIGVGWENATALGISHLVLDIWGVAYWAGEVFGFTGDGEFLRIDVDTGEGTVVESSSRSFWGAGVTPLAPVV